MTNRQTKTPYPIITVEYAIANNINPKAILSVAQFQDRLRTKRSAELAKRLRALAREVDKLTGYFARYRGERRPANDNRRGVRRAA